MFSQHLLSWPKWWHREIKTIRSKFTFSSRKWFQILLGNGKGQSSLRHFSGTYQVKTQGLQRSGSVNLNHQITTRVYKAFRLHGSGMNSSLAVTTHMWWSRTLLAGFRHLIPNCSWRRHRIVSVCLENEWRQQRNVGV